MTKPFDEKQSRRDFLRGLGRYLILGGLVATTGILVARRRGRSQTCLYTQEKRIGRGICQNCVFFNNCDLPSASSAREEMAR